MSTAFIFSLVIASSAASVEFTYSTLYDIYDFVGKGEVPLPTCNQGCLIFASTLGDGFKSTSGFDPYAENLIIYDDKNPDQNCSITDLSRKYDKQSSQKTPMTISGPASISVLNLNSPDDVASQIVLYVVERTKAAEFSYAVYDALNVHGVTINPNSIMTVMGADPFTVSARKYGMPNGVKARLTGFENARDSNSDACPLAYSIPTQNPFLGFNLNVNGPIISLLFTERNYETIDVKTVLDQFRDFNNDGFITSPGYNGCKGLRKGVQSFRSPIYETSTSFLMRDALDSHDVSIEVEPNTDAKHTVTVNDVTNGNAVTITGTKQVSFKFDKTQYVEVVFDDMVGDQGFLMRYKSTVYTTASTARSGNRLVFINAN